MKIEKVKVKFKFDGIEEEKIFELNDDWTYTTIDDLFEDWIFDNFDSEAIILEVDGKPFDYNE